jgi:hypothetical protein
LLFLGMLLLRAEHVNPLIHYWVRLMRQTILTKASISSQKRSVHICSQMLGIFASSFSSRKDPDTLDLFIPNLK